MLDAGLNGFWAAVHGLDASKDRIHVVGRAGHGYNLVSRSARWKCKALIYRYQVWIMIHSSRMFDLIACGARRKVRALASGCVDGYRGQCDRADGDENVSFHSCCLFNLLAGKPAVVHPFDTPAARKTLTSAKQTREDGKTLVEKGLF